MNDDEILAAAERIKARRLQEKRYERFKQMVPSGYVWIRWDNPHTFGESYTGFMVPASAVEGAVRAHFDPLIK